MVLRLSREFVVSLALVKRSTLLLRSCVQSYWHRSEMAFGVWSSTATHVIQ